MLLLLRVFCLFTLIQTLWSSPVVDPVERLLNSLINGTKRRDLVIYNRVPKSGSTSWQRYIDRLSRRLHYSAHHLASPPAIECPGQLDCIHTVDASPSPAALLNLSNSVTSLCKTSAHARCIVDYHFAFVNFSSIGQTQPIYINTVRHPIDRIISSYHYARHGPRDLYKRRQFIRMYGDLHIDECLDLYHKCGCVGDCTDTLQAACTLRRCQDLYYSFNSQMMFFCPWGSTACKQKDAEALKESLRVLQQYDAVGVLENLLDTTQLFESVLPGYFDGASSMKRVRAKTRASARVATKERKEAAPAAGEAVAATAVEILPLQHVSPERGMRQLSNSTLEVLQQLNALDLLFYEKAVELLASRHAAAVNSPAREALRAAMAGRRA